MPLLSKHSYDISKQIAMQDFPFYALIAAAMRQADSDNIEKLKEAFPEVHENLQRRYHSSGGWLPEENHPLIASYSNVEICNVCGRGSEGH